MHSGHYKYRQFNIRNFPFCLHNVFMCFVWIWEQTAIISLYSINWLVGFITETECVYCAVRSTFYVLPTQSICFVWIWEQTAIISLYSIDWLVGFYNWDAVCLLRGPDCFRKYNSGLFPRTVLLLIPYWFRM